MLYRISHPNIVRLVNVAVGPKVESVFLVFEFVEMLYAIKLIVTRRSFSGIARTI